MVRHPKSAERRSPFPVSGKGVRGLGLRLALALALPVTLSAQVSPAGTWRTVHSPHLRIHYRPGADSLAARAAREGERAWSLLARELPEPRASVDLVLSDAADFANGSATVFPSNRIVLLVTPPPSSPELQNYDDWLRVLLVHELGHIFHLDPVRGPWRLVQSIFGRVPGAFPNAYQPSWVAEGLATYYESRLTGRGRIHGSFHTQMLGAAQLRDRFLSPGEATFLSPRWPGGVAPYAYGSRFFDQVQRSAGDSSVPRFIRKSSGQWIPLRTGWPLAQATGLDRDSLWDLMRQRHALDAAAFRGQVIATGLRALPAPAVSPDGALAWFEVTGADPASIVVRRDGREERYRTTGGVDLSWSGDTLFATRLDRADPFTYRSDLFRLVGRNWTRLSHNARVTDLDAGPAGVVVVQLQPSGNRLAIWRDDTLVGLVPDDPAITWATPAVHPSGSIVAVQHDTAGYHLVRITPGTAREGELLTGRGNIVLSDPAWSPDGAVLFFVSDHSGVPQVYAMEPGGGVLQMTHEPGGARQPEPAADGWLYYSGYDADGFSLKRIAWDPELLPELLVEAPPLLPSATVANPLPDAPPVPGLRWTGYAPGAALRPHYWIPLVIDQGSAGVFLGAFTSGSDPVGRFGYGAQLTVGTNGARVDGLLSLVYQPWARPALDLFVSQDWGDAGVVDSPSARVVSRQRDLELGLSMLWARWYRTLSVRVAGFYEEDRFTSTPALDFLNPEFAGASLTLGWASLERPALSISNEDGLLVTGRYRRRWRLDRPGWSDDYRVRLAGYLGIKGLGGFAHPVLAARIAAATSTGPDREHYGVGGESGLSYQILPGIQVGSSRLLPVRGYQGGEIRGATAAVGTAELRVPLAVVARTLGGLPYGLDRVSANAFYDYGRAWRPPGAVSGGSRSISSTGVELTWDLVVLYDVPLRLRTGLAVALEAGPETPRGEVSFGVGLGTDF